MGVSIEVNSDNFAAEVVQKSYEKPVVVDFFAQWCGPCQMLKPILEKLVQEYDFVLAKVDIDQSPDLANTYGVEGVPDVKIWMQGEMRDGFVGVLPEPKLRSLLSELSLKSELEQGLETLQTAIQTGDVATAKQLLQALSEEYPEDRRLILAGAKFLVSQNKFESATKLLTAIQADDKEYFAQAQAIKALIQFQQIVTESAAENELDELFFKAIRLTLTEDYAAALNLFLELVSRNRNYRGDGARKAMIMIFDLLGDDHPLTKEYRKQLLLVLY
ncbi:tetratricopeptide repeat protein [Trichocoleus sp. FACHB-262]|uniref:tetratricopeptide repeat protein n=1 Tax=Trichocoleus sp. FACHB-262 TaxID=2692869 RepID=UPI001683A79A|nr:tetratricopeptide repeat protein [Trichocoleus sp. FACHB-262]MBD2120627.1 tetratricopeptide repeat protein [Trichocoleus sp. FACHB-262]